MGSTTEVITSLLYEVLLEHYTGYSEYHIRYHPSLWGVK